MTAYYNEIDPYRQIWLKNLIDAGHIAPGEVDVRSIVDVKSDDLKGYTQCHFFAGVGLWSLALRNAGCPDDRPVWTGSCPCQPFSQTGKKLGVEDERHLFPDWFGLIRQAKPARIFGEQVSSIDGIEWFAAVQLQLKNEGYETDGIDICSAGIGAPNIRQRLYWVAEPLKVGLKHPFEKPAINSGSNGAEPTSAHRCGLVHTDRDGLDEGRDAFDGKSDGNTFDTTSWRLERCNPVYFIDEKIRPIKPGIVPVVARDTRLVEQVRAYGDAINPVLAAEFIRANMEYDAL